MYVHFNIIVFQFIIKLTFENVMFLRKQRKTVAFLRFMLIFVNSTLQFLFSESTSEEISSLDV